MKADHFGELRQTIERYARGVPAGRETDARTAFDQFKAGLNAGSIRAAEREPDGVWRVNTWVKSGILLGFRLGRIEAVATDGPFPFFDKSTYPLKRLNLEDGVRVVPGGSALRDGCH